MVRRYFGPQEIRRALTLCLAVAMLTALFVGIAPATVWADSHCVGRSADPECQQAGGDPPECIGRGTACEQPAGGDKCVDEATGAQVPCPEPDPAEEDNEPACLDAAGAQAACPDEPGEPGDEPDQEPDPADEGQPEPEPMTTTDTAPDPAATGDLPNTGGNYVWHMASGLILIVGAALSLRRAETGR